MTKAAVMPSAVSNAPALDGSLRDYLETNADLVTHIKKPVSIDDIGALSAGLVTVPIYPTLPANQAEYILRDSGAVAVVCSTAWL